jgi:hypothetical protein
VAQPAHRSGFHGGFRFAPKRPFSAPKGQTMKKSNLVLLASLLLLSSLALPLYAATADFQGLCAAGIPTNCVFDATRTSSFGPGTSCAPSTVNQYFWNFNTTITTDDLFTTSSFVAYTYPAAYCDFVNLAVFCNNGQSPTWTNCLCNNIGINGCIRPGAGWTP